MTNIPVRTMRDMLDRLDALGYSPATARQIRPEIRRCARIYNAPLERISADPAGFDLRWGMGRTGAIAAGFASREQFLTWRKRVRAALARAAGRASPARGALLPDWAALLDFVRQGAGRGLPRNLDLSIGVLARHASAAGLTPGALQADWLAAACAGLKGRERRSFRCAIRSVNMLVARRQPGLAALLPAAPLAAPAPALAQSSPWRRGAHAPESRRLWEEFDEFVRRKRGVDALGRPIPPEAAGFGAAARKSYENALNAALNELTRIGRLRPGDAPSLRDVCCIEGIRATVESWDERRLSGAVSKEAPTLHIMVCRLGHIAATMGAKKAERKAIAELRARVKASCPSVGRMSLGRERWIRDFAANPAMQRALHALPETLMRRADEVLRDWDRRRAGAQGHMSRRMEALKLGVAACAMAILFRGSPVRARNLRTLKHRGDGAHLLRDASTQVLRLAIPAEEVKNRVGIAADCDADAAPVIDWYLREVRPRLIADHPFGHHAADSDYLFPSTAQDRALEETTFAGHCRFGTTAGGLDMTLHQARHVCAYLILDTDPNAWAQAAAVLGDTIPTVRAYYAWMDARRAGEAGRAALRQARTMARKHRRGRHDAA